ncbi:oxygenase MpaB family protein [Leifsonia sp. AG29]|uniref:oxygenase MpaB family protein n=1 Tax=Leifsonia sp. AG29 TaxID=2598860 RepID=UPI001E59F23A|nr:oxygenase MpaB family protein [Leifsonia sp. AG29]
MTSVPGHPTALAEIAGESLSLLGGGRALLLQIAHPSVGRGVAEHSDFAGRMLDRLHGTITFVYASVFATPEEFAEVKRAVDRAHGPVRGPADGPSPAYSAFDPELQLWVAATLYQTMIELHERFFGALEPATADAVYRDFTRLGLNLQVRSSQWPASRAAFDEYWHSMIGRLTVTEEARAIAAELLRPTRLPVWLRAVFPQVRLVTAGLLPDSVREQYGIPWDDDRRRRFERWMHWAVLVYRRLPKAARTAPRELYLRRMRRALREKALSRTTV